jgi:hypothetical protein
MSDKKRSISDVLRQEIIYTCFAWWLQKRPTQAQDETFMTLRASLLEIALVSLCPKRS